MTPEKSTVTLLGPCAVGMLLLACTLYPQSVRRKQETNDTRVNQSIETTLTAKKNPVERGTR